MSRENLFQVRLNDEESKILEERANSLGMKQTDYIRMLIKNVRLDVIAVPDKR